MSNIEEFVESIKSMRFDNAFNPYTDVCEAHDHDTSPNTRLNNLRSMLHSVPPGQCTMWIGRDPGYRGARRTGVPLTDEFHLSVAAKRYTAGRFEKATRTGIVKERTAAEVWRLLSATNDAPLMWNVFPLHPHRSEDSFSNRLHNRKERDAGLMYLDWLIKSFQPKMIVALGRDAYEGINKLGYGSIYVRHPSYGGQSEFRKCLGALYGTAFETKKQTLPLL